MRKILMFARNEEVTNQSATGFDFMKRSNTYQKRKLELLKKQDQRTDD